MQVARPCGIAHSKGAGYEIAHNARSGLGLSTIKGSVRETTDVAQ